MKMCDYFGIEIECIKRNGESNYRTPSLFRTTQDGSLSSGGIEFISEKIAFKDTEKIKHLKKSIKKIGKNHNIDATCGLHIHLNMPIKRLMQRQKFKKLILGYRLFEPILFSMVSKSRRHNSFCTKFSDFHNFKDLDIFLKSTVWDLLARFNDIPANTNYYDKNYGKGNKKIEIANVVDSNHGKSSNYRYLFANLQSIFYHGSIEIRLHQGTTDVNKIWNWLMLHKRFITHLLSLDIKDILTLYEKFGQEAFWEIVKNDKLKKYYQDRIKEFGKIKDGKKNYNIIIANAYLKKEQVDEDKIFKAMIEDEQD